MKTQRRLHHRFLSAFIIPYIVSNDNETEIEAKGTHFDNGNA
jgi:hypothetical protein